MKRNVLPAARKGRPPSERAASHAAIMDAVYALLQAKSVRDLTMEEVAKRAKVGKPTLYKWWPTKAALVLAILCEPMALNLEKPTALTAEESLRFRVRRLIDAFNGPFGKIVAGLIAEGQSEPAVLQEFFGRWVSPRRNATITDLQRGKDAGELRAESEPELLNDTIFGAIYYRFLLRSGTLTRRFGDELVEQVLRGGASFGAWPRSLGLIGSLALDTDWPCLYNAYMNDSIGFALLHAGHRVEARLEEALAAVKLSGAKHAALSVLVTQDEPISLSELAKKLTCVRSNITQLVDRLEADGLVKRIDDPADRRAVRAEVTRLGRKRHAAGTKVVNAVLQEVAKELAAVDPKMLKRALDAVQ
jgi:DNA-binding MarR family transcriptional regulator